MSTGNGEHGNCERDMGAYVLGATTLKDFGLALLIGLLTGAYSSIFVASPILAILKEREPRYSAIRQRILETPHSRLPVAEGTVDKLVGVVQLRDIVAAQIEGRSLNLRDLVRAPGR